MLVEPPSDAMTHMASTCLQDRIRKLLEDNEQLCGITFER
jgi:hypothetical protein